MNEISLYTQCDLLCRMHLLLQTLEMFIMCEERDVYGVTVGAWPRVCVCVRVNACIYVHLSRDNDVVGGNNVYSP